MTPQNATQPSPTRWFPWVASALGLAAVVAFVVYYPPANEIAREAGRIVFTVIFTPFILEAVCIIVGILIVITINNKRLERESKDEWVYLHQIDPESPVEVPDSHSTDIPEPLKRRIEDASFIAKPSPAGASERLAEIGGFVDLGMLDEASAALLDAPEDEVKTLPYLLQRIRLAKLREDSEKVASLSALARTAGATDNEIESAINGKFAG